MSSKIYSVELSGLDGHLVEIEIDTRRSMPKVTIVGLPDAAVQESKERVISAVKNSGYKVPRGRVIINLAPADLKKNGPRYDLSIAIGILAFSELVPKEHFAKTIFLGELALNGDLRPITGVLPSVEFAKQAGFSQVMIPAVNATEGAMVGGIKIIPVRNLREAVLHLGDRLCALNVVAIPTIHKPIVAVDMQDIKGQTMAKRSLEIAAAGGHNVLMSGSPGSGKTLMAKALQGILPAMSFEEMMEVTKVYSVSGLLPKSEPLITTRPFRVVHHTASSISIVGGGKIPGPGEISLAHRGILFMDEIAEFPSHVLEVLRQPMEDRHITISRASGTVRYPAQFTLVAAMNPCPCGYLNVENSDKPCTCPRWKVERYTKRLSGPLLDRFDIQLNIQPVPHKKLMSSLASESSAVIRERIEKAVQVQQDRFKDYKIQRNSEMDNPMLKQLCPLDTASETMLEEAVLKYELSARSYFRTIKLARTIADLAGDEKIEVGHVAEALQLRIRN